MKMTCNFILACALTLALTRAAAQTAAPRISCSILAGGGGSASGGNFSVTHSLGEPFVGASSGGDFDIGSGFMSQEITPEGATLNVSSSAAAILATENIARSLTLSVTNSGSLTASNAELQITMPPGVRVTALTSTAGSSQFNPGSASCSGITLAPGGNFTANLTIRADFLPLGSALLVNAGDLVAVVTSDGTALNSADARLALPVSILAQTDWGDARGGFPVTVEENGAHHRYSPAAPWLGARWDNDGIGNHSTLADFDDTRGATDDEDGIAFPRPVIAGSTATVAVTCANASGFLDAWADFNNDGDWDDPGERIFAGRLLAVGTNVLTFGVPAAATSGSITTRWRMSTTGGLGYTGYGGVGEVEDHMMELHAAPKPGLEVMPGLVSLSFPSEPQLTYLIECVDSISGESWLPLARVAGNGSVLTITDDTTRPMRFYRVRVE